MVAPAARFPRQSELEAQIAQRLRQVAGSYVAPEFAEVPHADAALFLTAIDHRTGYRRSSLIGGKGPFDGSALLWQLGLAAERRHPGLLTAQGLAEVSADQVEAIFRVGGETVSGPEDRARLWRDAAAVLRNSYDGSAAALLAACEGRLAGSGGLLSRLGELEAYSDPLQKKSFLFAKIAERRGWLAVTDPESWQVCPDNVLMRLALRAGLVHPGPAEVVRVATRDAFKRLADESGLAPPLLDDLLWSLGKRDPDLLGTAGGKDLDAPPRPEGTFWY